MSSESTNTSPNKIVAIAQSALKIAWKVFVVVADWIWRKSRLVLRYYWERRSNFWEHFTEYARDLRPERFLSREIRLSTEEQYLNAEFDNDTWTVRLPKMCVVCGTQVEGKPESASYKVENLTGPFWSVIVGLFAGLMLWLLVWDWFLPIGIVLGFAVGYGRHSVIRVKLRQFKCDKHRETNRFPRLRTFADFLIISVGSKELRQEFRRQRFGDRNEYGTYARTEPVDESYAAAPPVDHQVPEIEPIPLADEVHESIERDDRERLNPTPRDDSDITPL